MIIQKMTSAAKFQVLQSHYNTASVLTAVQMSFFLLSVDLCCDNGKQFCDSSGHFNVYILSATGNSIQRKSIESE